MSVLDMNYTVSVCLNNVAKATVCFCWTNLVSVIEVTNSNVKQWCTCLDCRSKPLTNMRRQKLTNKRYGDQTNQTTQKKCNS